MYFLVTVTTYTPLYLCTRLLEGGSPFFFEGGDCWLYRVAFVFSFETEQAPGSLWKGPRTLWFLVLLNLLSGKEKEEFLQLACENFQSVYPSSVALFDILPTVNICFASLFARGVPPFLWSPPFLYDTSIPSFVFFLLSVSSFFFFSSLFLVLEVFPFCFAVYKTSARGWQHSWRFLAISRLERRSLATFRSFNGGLSF